MARAPRIMQYVGKILLTIGIFSAWGTPSLAGPRPAIDGSTDRCLSCHREGSRAHIHDWQESLHARSGIACTNCHVIESIAAHAAPSSPDRESTGRDAASVIEICEPCHQEVGRAFRQSLHYRRAGRGEATPVCVDCHSSAGGYILSGDLIPQRCGTCHRKGGAAGQERAWVAEKAPQLLRLLRRVALARTMVEEKITRLKRLGAKVAWTHREIRKVNAGFQSIPVEWHRFNLTDAEERSETALRRLAMLHEQLDQQLARMKHAPSPKTPPIASPAVYTKGKPLHFAVASMLGPSRTYDEYLGLFNDLQRRLGRPYQFMQRRTYREINDLLLRGKLDLAFICSGAYAALPENAPIEIVAIPVVNGQTVYHSLLITRQDNPAQRLDDLKGRRFAFTDPLSHTGYVYPVFRLSQSGVKPSIFFSSTLFSGSHDRSILAVYRNLVDAAAVDDLVFNQLVVPESRYWNHLRVIETSPDFPMPPVVAPLSVPADMRAQMRRFFLDLRETPGGRRRLAALGVDGFTTTENANYTSIRRMLEANSAALP